MDSSTRTLIAQVAVGGQTTIQSLGIRKQFLSDLFHLFQDASLIAGAIDGRLEFLAELGKPFEPLMFVECRSRGGFQRHKSIRRRRLVVAQIRGANAIPTWTCGPV